ncbi:MAG TPA: hypothetical protein VHC49_03470 [Mycobacteriales bacterium]|nr:hypothetical protein [Mycobacteriales bacterium]
MFIQLVEFETTRFDEGKSLNEEYRAKVRGKGSGRRSTVCQDRDNPNHYVVAIEFDSYEDAMRNSELPETQEFSEKMSALTIGGPRFTNLEVLEVREEAPA